MARILNIAGIVVGSIGLSWGAYYLSNNPELSLKIVTSISVGIVGILAFIRHVIFHKSDAARMGWETERPDWQFEVGFANLAFGAIALLAVFTNQGMNGQSLVLVGYAVYLFQAGILHGYRYFTDEKKVPARLWRSCLLTLVYAGMMLFFAVYTASI